jgi:hypothetical protein
MKVSDVWIKAYFLLFFIYSGISVMMAFITRLKYHAWKTFAYIPALLVLTDLPDPVTNCTAYNATAYTMQFTCVPGNDGGIKQSFFVEVINPDACNNFHHKLIHVFVWLTFLPSFSVQVFDGKEKVFNVTYEQPTFLLRKLPSDTRLTVRVSFFVEVLAFNFPLKI